MSLPEPTLAEPALPEPALPQLTPRLVVDDAEAAINFYRDALGATEIERMALDDGVIVHAEMKVGRHSFYLTESSGDHNLSPEQLGGSPLLLVLVVESADATGARFTAAGGEVVFPIDDQFYGRREGRLRDPFGHLWIISQAEPES